MMHKLWNQFSNEYTGSFGNTVAPSMSYIYIYIWWFNFE